ncbi:glycolipid transfer protein domain-containing protein [Suillus subaureus]|uniref:Glycolipid transfer protein domain-containing protein n=1 Tax=Suillus subaureus TaxID=48587 RepID=A0A9P7DT22_9AGAM|nr:glycolipid transfer protein domain-containing protein [Suillus subaureus]KAG1802504.1 glycolipid transfer protein domain-containing protein [Suillus subaureus]
MAPFLETVKSFKDVPINDDGVNTVAFLEAGDGVVRMLKELTGLMSTVGSKAFSPVINDIQGNITKVRERSNAAPSQSATLELLVTNENNNKVGSATEGLMWLLRSLAFTGKSLQHAQNNPSEDLKVAFTKGYDVTLGPIHRGAGFFSTAIGYCPPRKNFYEKLAANPNGEPCSQELLDKQLNDWITGLDTIITRMDKFYTKGKHGEIYKSA